MFVNTLGGNMNRLYIQSLGYDAERQLPYVVADVDADIAEGALLSNKTHANVIRMDTYSHTENQTFDMMLSRHNYSQGDNYMYYAGFRYMGDVHSTAGDENGVLYAAFPVSMMNIFRGAVETFTPQTAELKYRGATNAHTLASGRPIINMNPAKWVTAGSAHIIHPGGALIGYADRVRSYDAPWTKEVVGRYIAIDEPDEYVPGSDRVRRWYYIAGFGEKDGLKWLSIQRHWWGAKNNVSITRLYNPAHYTTGMERKDAKPLKYIIAPGANVYDVARGVRDDGQWGGQYVSGALDRMVKLSPGPHLGTAFDFAPGDPIEQAMGPDPFKPIPFRSWLFENVPGVFPAPVLDVANHGATMRHAVLTVDGGSSLYADYRNPAKPLPQLPWNKIIEVQSACNEGIAFAGDTADAAIAFRQPGQPQQMKWSGSDWNSPQGIMGVSNNGDLELWWRTRGYKGEVGGVDLAGADLVEVSGLAGNRATEFYAIGGAGKAANFRGVQVAVPQGAESFTVTFPTAEKDGAYAVTVSPSWMTAHAVTERTAAGFTVRFNRPAPAGATVDWMLVR
ncbi:MAG: hypothetical protein BWY76_03069 [bacterium ADurb.Bin429]|nr:MAG: hypothetical protein BWY76_03069 [bacterium ADurb.Bin429]